MGVVVKIGPGCRNVLRFGNERLRVVCVSVVCVSVDSWCIEVEVCEVCGLRDAVVETIQVSRLR